MSIIPFDNLVSIPEWISSDGSKQFCSYKVCDDDSFSFIGENTKFPSFKELVDSVYNHLPMPETTIEYSVLYGYATSETINIPVPQNALRVNINPEPFYNEKTGCCDLFAVTIVFSDLKSAYDYAISHKVVESIDELAKCEVAR